MPFKHLLVPTDLRPATHHAYPHAAALARALGASITVLHVDDVIILTKNRDEFEAEMQDHSAAIEAHGEEILASLHKWGVDARFQVVRGNPRQEIVETARAEGCDLIVMPRRSRTKLKWLLLGSTAERVLRTAPMPVLVTMRGSADPEAEALPSYRQLLAATNLTDVNVDALQVVMPLARTLDASVTLMHVARTPRVFSRKAGRAPITILPKRSVGPEDDLDTELARVAAAMGEGVERRLAFGRDQSAQILEAAAQEEADIVALAASGKGRAELGSTAARVVLRSSVPVLVVPLPGR